MSYSTAHFVGGRSTHSANEQDSFHGFHPEVKSLRGRALRAPTVTTSNCNSFRLAPYPAELQLFYEYSVEFKAGRAVSLADLERAVSNAVALELDVCDALDRPMYKVKTNTRHIFSDTGK
jgi:hypothetical protein